MIAPVHSKADQQEKNFPEGMEPLGKRPFQFRCHPGVPCFTVCCRKVDLILYPYDIVRLKRSLDLHSAEFLERHTRLVKGTNAFFPTVMMQLAPDDAGDCPFLKEKGCSVYADRPTACRTYPLERAVDRSPGKREQREYFFLTHHDYCKGHFEEGEVTVKSWLRSQQLAQYNLYNELWTELDTLFAQNPWQGEGQGGPKQQLAFMVCYNIDSFRELVVERHLLSQFRLSSSDRKSIMANDEELLKFGFAWLHLILSGRSSLVSR